VYSMQLEFKRPAELDALLDVSCSVHTLKGARVEFTQEVRDALTQLLYCRATVCVVCISLATKKPRRLPDDVARALDSER
jgi:acyl-CoA thioesterase FadM